MNLQFNATFRWIQRIKSILMESNAMLPQLQSLPPSAAGAELLRQFIIDLLGRDTAEAIIFDRKRQIRWSGANGKNYISHFQCD